MAYTQPSRHEKPFCHLFIPSKKVGPTSLHSSVLGSTQRTRSASDGKKYTFPSPATPPPKYLYLSSSRCLPLLRPPPTKVTVSVFESIFRTASALHGMP